MLHFREAGEGPPLVLIHGLFGSLENLGGLARPLSERFKVYSIDLPNHGRSPHGTGTTIASMAAQLGDWLETQGLGSCLLLGHSLGGKVAMELALSAPDKVERLLVLDIAPSAYTSRHQSVFNGLRAIQPDRLATRAEAEQILSEHVPEAGVRSFLLKNLVKADSGFQWRMNLLELASAYPELIAENRAGTFGGPTLFVKGGRSDYLQEEHRADVLGRFPYAQFKVVADAGHWLHAEKPGIVAALAMRFFAD